jgi:DNA recombination protein RmuC
LDLITYIAGALAVVGCVSSLYLYRFYSKRSFMYDVLEKDLQAAKQEIAEHRAFEQEREKEFRELYSEKNRLEAKLTEREESYQRELAQFNKQKEELEKSFQALASKALETNSDQFLRLATERLDRKSMEHVNTLKEKSEQFQQIVTPINEIIKKLETDITKVEKERLEQFSKITEQLKSVTDASDSLRKEASSLSSALRRPEVRGSWGELQLKRVVELAGMSQYCDYEEQVSLKKEESLQKPDMVVRLPNDRVLVIDSKAVLDAFLDAVEADTPEKRQVALERHAKNLRARVKELAKKSYWDQFENTPDFVVLFVPNEALLQAAVEQDRDILEDALSDRIIVATPTTLVALLKAVAYGWQQESIAENAMEVIKTSKELYERVAKWVDKMGDVGTKLQSATRSYNEAVGSLERRVLPSARRIKDLGLKEMADLPNLAEIDLNARELKAVEPELSE